VNKDNLLFATIGLLLGFISGYLLHEVMMARQPLRRLAGEAAAVTPGPTAADGAGSAEPGPQADAAAPGAGAAPPATADAAGSAGTSGNTGGAGGNGGGGAAGAPPPAMAAIQQLRDYVATHPKDAGKVLELANLNFDINNWGRARDLYTRYLGLREPNPDVLTDLGICYRGLRQFDRALEQFRRAEQLAPAHLGSRYNEVLVLELDLNQAGAADQAFARLQALAPAQPEVVRLGAELRRRRGQG
jgi:hypothetical protein